MQHSGKSSQKSARVTWGAISRAPGRRTRALGYHIRDLVRCRAPGENCEEYAAPEECGMSIRPAPPARRGERLQSYGCSAFTGESPSSARKCQVIKLLKYVRFCQSQTSHRYMLRRTG